MNLLVDTHVLLWWLVDSPELGESARTAIGERDNVVFVSAASVWEIVIKRGLGKLEIPEDFKEVLNQQPFLSLDVTAVAPSPNQPERRTTTGAPGATSPPPGSPHHSTSPAAFRISRWLRIP